MKAYIFSKSDRVIFNFVNNPIKLENNIISSNLESFSLSKDDDFIVSDKQYNINDIIPNTENNKEIKSDNEILKEQIQALGKQITNLMLGGM